jgi:hypothetical protein
MYATSGRFPPKKSEKFPSRNTASMKSPEFRGNDCLLAVLSDLAPLEMGNSSSNSNSSAIFATPLQLELKIFEKLTAVPTVKIRLLSWNVLLACNSF